MIRTLLAIVALFMSGSSLATTDGTTDQWQQFRCGDHWLNVQILLNDSDETAIVSFDGDSNPNRDDVAASAAIDMAKGSITVYLQDELGGSLVLTQDSVSRVWTAQLQWSLNDELSYMGGNCR